MIRLNPKGFGFDLRGSIRNYFLPVDSLTKSLELYADHYVLCGDEKLSCREDERWKIF